MTKKTLLMFAAAGLLTPVAAGTATAETTVTKMIAAPKLDKAPVNNQGRLRRTNEEQAGNEMSAFFVFQKGANKGKGMYFAMSTELVGTDGTPVPAPGRVQLSGTPFTLAQTATGAVTVAPIANGASRFVTNNVNVNDYRSGNHPSAYVLNDNLGCVEYNVQPDNSDDTKRYIQCFKADGTRALNQTLIFAKNNDDASQRASGETRKVTQWINGGKTAYMCGVEGANGNGRDNGWLNCFSLTVSDDGNSVTHQAGFDVTIAEREERTRGKVSFGTDPNTAIVTWTEGNTQPCYDGTWIAAIDVTPGKFTGADKRESILWKQMIRGRVDTQVAGKNQRTYSMRADHVRVSKADPATGELRATDEIIFYANDLIGRNNTNYKGGEVKALTMGVIHADKTGMKFVKPLEDANQVVKGIGGTHIHMAESMFGTVGNLQPGAMFINGSHTGGRFASEGRAMSFDVAANKFVDLGKVSAAPFDRHMYSNYLGNNPGNQGRNYAHAEMIVNPFFGQNGNQDMHLMLFSSTAKAEEDVDAGIKLSAFLTIMPVTSAPAGTPAPSDPSTPADPADPENPADGENGSSDALGGCSTTGTSGGLATFLLIGLAAFIRRRRS